SRRSAARLSCCLRRRWTRHASACYSPGASPPTGRKSVTPTAAQAPRRRPAAEEADNILRGGLTRRLRGPMARSRPADASGPAHGRRDRRLLSSSSAADQAERISEKQKPRSEEKEARAGGGAAEPALEMLDAFASVRAARFDLTFTDAAGE